MMSQNPLNMQPAVRGAAPPPMSTIQPVAPAAGGGMAGRAMAMLNQRRAEAGAGEAAFTPGRPFIRTNSR
jgi:hypothetical protein